MGQKVHPVGIRVGIIRDWSSRWFARKKEFGDLLVEDQKIRRFIQQRYNDFTKRNAVTRYAAISSVEIERYGNELKVFIYTARPGLIIGRKGAKIETLKGELHRLTDKKVSVDTIEIAKIELNAQLVAENIAEQLSKRMSFRRVLKKAAEQAMMAGAKGVKILLSGRLGGAEMARREKKLLGSVPLQTLTADVDYGFAEAPTTHGNIGCKVWIYRGRKEGRHASTQEGKAPQSAAR